MARIFNTLMFTRKCTNPLFFILLAFTLAGCAAPIKTSTVFFPPPPDSPRIQYLTAINGSDDIEDKKSTFTLLVTGKGEEERVRLIAKPYGVATYNGKIYVCDISLGRIFIIDPSKKSFSIFAAESSYGKLSKPSNVAFDVDGNMYVADVGRQEIVIFDKTGKYINAIGKELGGKPTDVAVDDVYIYILDYLKSQIHLFERGKLNFVRSIGRDSEKPGENLALPTNLALDNKGFLYATNIRGTNVVKLDKDGHFLLAVGKLGDGMGQFSRPKGIAVDEAGQIYVVDSAHQNVQIFNAAGRLLIYFGSPGLPAGSLNLPAGISVTKDNLEYFRKYADPSFELESLIFVTNQFGPAKLSVYGFGHSKQGSEEPKDAGPNPSGKEKKDGAGDSNRNSEKIK